MPFHLSLRSEEKLSLTERMDIERKLDVFSPSISMCQVWCRQQSSGTSLTHTFMHWASVRGNYLWTKWRHYFNWRPAGRLAWQLYYFRSTRSTIRWEILSFRFDRAACCAQKLNNKQLAVQILPVQQFGQIGIQLSLVLRRYERRTMQVSIKKILKRKVQTNLGSLVNLDRRNNGVKMFSLPLNIVQITIWLNND